VPGWVACQPFGRCIVWLSWHPLVLWAGIVWGRGSRL